MKLLILFFGLLFCIVGCQFSRFVFKEITVNDIIDTHRHTATLCWYRESYLTKTKAFVSMTVDGDENIFLKVDEPIITDVELKHDTIIIKCWGLSNVVFYQKKPVTGFHVLYLDATYKEWFKTYHSGEPYPEDAGKVIDNKTR